METFPFKRRTARTVAARSAGLAVQEARTSRRSKDPAGAGGDEAAAPTHRAADVAAMDGCQVPSVALDSARAGYGTFRLMLLRRATNVARARYS